MAKQTTTRHIDASLAGASPQTIVLEAMPNNGDAATIRVRVTGRDSGTPTEVAAFVAEVAVVSDGMNATGGSQSVSLSQSASFPGTNLNVNFSGTDVVFEAGYPGGTTIDWLIDVEVTRHA